LTTEKVTTVDMDDLDGDEWIDAELQDVLDEEYELEMSEPALSIDLRRIFSPGSAGRTTPRPRKRPSPSEKTERRIYTLTVLAAIFMPLSFVTGLLGVNLAGIPEATDPLAFLALCGLLSVIVLVQLLILRLKGWL